MGLYNTAYYGGSTIPYEGCTILYSEEKFGYTEVQTGWAVSYQERDIKMIQITLGDDMEKLQTTLGYAMNKIYYAGL